MRKTRKREFGDWGEQQAVRFLIAQGYEVVDRNYHVREGEIDIIAWQQKERFGKTLCFIEVKTRRRNDGAAERATGHYKQQRFIKAARQYCVQKKIDVDRTPIQFEQVSVYIARPGDKSAIKHWVIPVDS